MKKSAGSILDKFSELEPNLINAKNDEVLILSIQSDTEGIIGDVRDIVLSRAESNWEIGISLKHNHFAVKHSRLSKNIDFCEKWFDGKCSEEYFNKISPRLCTC